MKLPASKTKIVATIGPASCSPPTLEALILAGMNVARLNFSHGDFEGHGRVIDGLRTAALKTGRDIAIMADLPGPKIRLGTLAQEPIELKPGDAFTLTAEPDVSQPSRVSVTWPRLPRVLSPGDHLYLNDGIIQLKVSRIRQDDVECRVVIGGELRSRKGLNLPGINLGISAFTARDRACLQFALERGVDVVSQSFVDSAQDVLAVREAARELGYEPFILAKIERRGALDRVDEILETADGIMVARGDLGVEVPIEHIAVLQKQLLQKARRTGKPVITATQMLESMTVNRQPTRAEATDVANAILDGTDCVMLSAESAMGRYPVEAVATLARIAAATEPHRSRLDLGELLRQRLPGRHYKLHDHIALAIEAIFELAPPVAIVVPTRSGATARSIARYRLPIWVASAADDPRVCRHLHLSYGILPVHTSEVDGDWTHFTREWIRRHALPGEMAVLVQGPSEKHPDANHRIELIELTAKTA